MAEGKEKVINRINCIKHSINNISECYTKEFKNAKQDHENLEKITEDLQAIQFILTQLILDFGVAKQVNKQLDESYEQLEKVLIEQNLD